MSDTELGLLLKTWKRTGDPEDLARLEEAIGRMPGRDGIEYGDGDAVFFEISIEGLTPLRGTGKVVGLLPASSERFRTWLVLLDRKLEGHRWSTMQVPWFALRPIFSVSGRPLDEIFLEFTPEMCRVVSLYLPRDSGHETDRDDGGGRQLRSIRRGESEDGPTTVGFARSNPRDRRNASALLAAIQALLAGQSGDPRLSVSGDASGRLGAAVCDLRHFLARAQSSSPSSSSSSSSTS